MTLDDLTDEVLRRCDILGEITEEPGRITRTFLRPVVHQVHDLLRKWMTEAGLAVRVDAVGNVVGRASGAGARDGIWVVGSHVDTVPNAGKFDGVLGVLLGIAAAKSLGNRKRARTLDVIAFSEEEGVRFRTPYLGSRAVAGSLTAELLARRDSDGSTVTDAIAVFGLRPEEIPAAAYRSGEVVGYLEAHIEQGPVLESRQLSLGIVPAIMGQTRAWVRFRGRAGHAGTEPMHLRRDALAAAAGFVTNVEKTAREIDGLRATVGSLTVSPNATNVVPGEVRLSLDVRHAEDAVREMAVHHLSAAAHLHSSERHVAVEFEPALDQPAVVCDSGLTARLAKILESQGHPPERVVSGAGHDAVVMAEIAPVAMLFLRSPGCGHCGIQRHSASRTGWSGRG